MSCASLLVLQDIDDRAMVRTAGLLQDCKAHIPRVLVDAVTNLFIGNHMIWPDCVGSSRLLPP